MDLEEIKQDLIPVLRKSETELKALAYRIVVKGDIFIDRYLEEDKDAYLMKVFAPLLKLNSQNLLKLQNEVGMFFAEESAASEHTIHSPKTNRIYKMYLSIRMIHKEDMEELGKWLNFYTDHYTKGNDTKENDTESTTGGPNVPDESNRTNSDS